MIKCRIPFIAPGKTQKLNNKSSISGIQEERNQATFRNRTLKKNVNVGSNRSIVALLFTQKPFTLTRVFIGKNLERNSGCELRSEELG